MINKAILLFVGIALFSSCKNDIDTIQSLGDISDIPQLYARNIQIVHSDSAKISMKMFAPELKRFPDKDKPYTEFPKGINITVYDDYGKESSKIRANYAIYYEEEKLWEARYDVIAESSENKKLFTEYLVWEEEKEIIHSDQYVKVIDQGVIMQGIGFESNEEFTRWRILKPTGEIEIQE